MAKQTFTTGQVLTAAQMTSLQQTAMGGGSTTAKTTSYVLVAADAGTVVQMNSASATTITVNTALFAAGDTVQIQNIGAGVCTVTAGTATVSTSATLALKQYDSGELYFNTTSAALFFNTDAADNASPLTTKGDLYGFSTLDARIPIGTNNQVLTADSAQALGLKWATPASGGKVLQVLMKDVSSAQSSSSSTYVDITGFSQAITPSAASSKVLVTVTIGNCIKNSANNGNQINFKLFRGATLIFISTAVGGTYPTAMTLQMPVSFTYLDSPATTSATTYKVQFANDYNGAFVTVMGANDGGNIIVAEIGA